ncbi:MAG: hypothetical protein HYY17_09770 [Planctomycetes bacterium]|nr:hypothetical protein [Planctomycetota bacterium]
MRAAAIFLLLAAACDTTPTVGGHRQPPPAVVAPPDQWQGVRVLAVTPPDNWTTDLELQYTNWFRAVIMAYLERKGFETVPLPVIHRSMRKWKFTLAGELALFRPSELCQEWKCDAIVCWDILRDGQLSFSCIKADGTMLWASGPRRLEPVYNIVVDSPLTSQHRTFSVTICECLRDFPRRGP